MISIAIFRDLEIEIEIILQRMKDIEREDYALTRIQFNEIDLERYASRKHKLNNEMAILQSVLEDKELTIQEITSELEKLEGLEYKIAYKRFVEGKSLKEIASELGYKYKYIQNISYKMSGRVNYV